MDPHSGHPCCLKVNCTWVPTDTNSHQCLLVSVFVYFFLKILDIVVGLTITPFSFNFYLMTILISVFAMSVCVCVCVCVCVRARNDLSSLFAHSKMCVFFLLADFSTLHLQIFQSSLREPVCLSRRIFDTRAGRLQLFSAFPSCLCRLSRSVRGESLVPHPPAPPGHSWACVRSWPGTLHMCITF